MNKPFTLNPWRLIGGWKKEKLKSPFITIIQNQDRDYEIEILWDMIENSDKYKIYINGKLIDTTLQTSINHIFTKNGTYEIYVKSYDGEDYSPSGKSNIISITVSDVGMYLIGNGKNILINMKKVLIRG